MKMARSDLTVVLMSMVGYIDQYVHCKVTNVNIACIFSTLRDMHMFTTVN